MSRIRKSARKDKQENKEHKSNSKEEKDKANKTKEKDAFSNEKKPMNKKKGKKTNSKEEKDKANKTNEKEAFSNEKKKPVNKKKAKKTNSKEEKDKANKTNEKKKLMNKKKANKTKVASSDEKKKPMTEKKVLKMENKKRKLEAFLALVDKVEENQLTNSTTRPSVKDEDSVTDTLETPAKKQRLSTITNGDENGHEEEIKESSGKENDSSLSHLDYSELKRMKREYDKTKLPYPFIEVLDFGQQNQIISSNETTVPLNMRDVQGALLNHLMPGTFPMPPRYIHIGLRKMISHHVVVVVEGAGIRELQKCAKKSMSTDDTTPMTGDVEKTGENATLPDWLTKTLPKTCTSFSPTVFEVFPSSSANPLDDLLGVTSGSKDWNPVIKGSEELENSKDGKENINGIGGMKVPNKDSTDSKEKLPKSDTFDRRRLILTPAELYQFNYPVPTSSNFKGNGYVFSKPKYDEVKPTSPMFGIDCEMCMTCIRQQELTRISVVNENLQLVYHKLVKPPNRITNYLTKYSGITEKMLRNVFTTLEDVHNDLQKLLPSDAIIVGHSLQNDLKAMKIMHPYVIDSSLAYNLTYAKNRLSSLKTLSKMFLAKDIQTGGADGHDATEDAASSLELILLKLKNGFSYGNVLEGFNDMQGRAVVKKGSSHENFTNVFQHVAAKKMKTAIVMKTDQAECYKDVFSSLDKERVDFHLLNDNTELSKMAASVAMSKDLMFLHLKLDKMKLGKDHRKETFKKLDKRLQRIYNGACQRALVTFIFTGSHVEGSDDKCSNGLVMINIKKMEETVASEKEC